MSLNRQYLLRSRPASRPHLEHFQVCDAPLPADDALPAGQVRVRVIYLSVDPTNRVWMSDMPQYMPPVRIGEVMRSMGLGVVEASGSPDLSPGDVVVGLLGWQAYFVGPAGALWKVPTGHDIPLSTWLGALGTTGGLTAYFGLLHVGQARAGETVIVTSAAGSVGSLAGQIARLKGCRVIGVAGSDAKCRYVTDELGFDACINYRSQDVGAELSRLAPHGIDVDFENVGGSMLDKILSRMRLHGRIALCGLIEQYNNPGGMGPGPTRFGMIVTRRLRIEGFIVSDFISSYHEAYAELIPWVRSGALRQRLHILPGLDQAVPAVNMLFDGENFGKLLIQVSAEP